MRRSEAEHPKETLFSRLLERGEADADEHLIKDVVHGGSSGRADVGHGAAGLRLADRRVPNLVNTVSAVRLQELQANR